MSPLALLAPLALTGAVSHDEIGFSGFELYELSGGAFGLHAGDFDGDGLGDLVVVENTRSRLSILRRLPADAADFEGDEGPLGTNEVSFDRRFERVPLPEERRVTHLAVGDFDGDGTDDLAWVAQGGHLTIVCGPRALRADVPRSRRVDALARGCEALVAGDLFPEDPPRAELLAVGDASLLALATEEGSASEQVLDHLEQGLDRLDLVDLDGDGRADLVYTRFQDRHPLEHRLQVTPGVFGPRCVTALPGLRSVFAHDRPGAGAEVLAVFRKSGRLAAYALPPDAEAGGVAGLARYPMNSDGESGGSSAADSGASALGLASGDIDGDGTLDVACAKARTAEVVIQFGRAGSSVRPEARFPSLIGARAPRAVDLDGDGTCEVLVLSVAERMLGIARWEDGRLGFPTSRATLGEPMALDAGDVDGDGRLDVVVATTLGEGRKRETRLEVWLALEQGGLAAQPEVHVLDGLGKEPRALRLFDLDRDGRADAMLFVSGGDEVPRLFVSEAQGFVRDARGEEAPGLGLLRGRTPESVSGADVDGDGVLELLVAADSFVRAVYFEREGEGRLHLAPRVVAQVAAPGSDARLQAATLLEPGPSAARELVAFDARGEELLFFGNTHGDAWSILRRVPAAGLEAPRLEVGDADGDGQAQVLVLDGSGVALWASGSSAALALVETGAYQPRRPTLGLAAIAVADLSGDGRANTILTETSEHALAILGRDAGGGFQHELGFRVFEAKSFYDRNEGREPRELVATDLTGDGRADLALLVHDKLLVYVLE